MINEFIHNNIDGLIETTLNGTGDSDAHLMTLLGIAMQVKPKYTVELGVREGVSTFPLLLGTVLSGGKMVSCDIQPQYYEPQKELESHWTFVQSDVIEFLRSWEETGTIMDLVFIDDWHEHIHVRTELQLISNYIDRNSVILLHDCMSGQWRQKDPQYMQPDYFSDTGEFAGGGPSTAVRELDPNVWEWATIPVYHGLTILRLR